MTGEEVNILYVDDELRNLKAFQLLFRKQYNIITAMSGQEGLEILESREFQLIITDQRMPEMTGTEFLKIVKERWPDSKYILLTGYTDHDAIKEAINEIGIYLYINKPFETNQMVLSIKSALESYKTERDQKNTNERLRSFLESATDSIISFDENQIITMINPATTQLFEYTKDELLGKNLEILLLLDMKAHGGFVMEKVSVKGEIPQSNPAKVLYGKSKSGRMIAMEITISKMQLNGKNYYNTIIRDISQRLADEAMVQKREQEFKRIFYSITDMYMRLDLEDNCLIISPAVKQILGYDVDEFIINNPPIDFYRYKEEREQAKKEIIDKGYTRNFRFEAIKKDGSICSLSANSDLIYDEQGKPKYIQAMVRDITKLVEAERIIETQQERLVMATKAANLGIWDWDIVNDQLIWDDAMYAMYGLNKEEVKNEYESWVSILHPEDKILSKEATSLALSGEKKYDTQFRIIKPNGSIRHIRAVASVISDEKGVPIRMVGCNWDYTKIQVNEDKLQENALLFKEAEKLANLGIWQLNLITNEITWSDELFRIYGLKIDSFEPSLELYFKIVHVEDRERVHEIIEECLNSTNSARFEERIVRPDGKERILNTWLSIFKDDKGKVKKMFGTCLDVTEIKIKENALISSEAEFRSLAENAPSYILKINKKFEIEYINKLIPTLKMEDVIGASAFFFIPEDDIKRVKKIYKAVFQTGQASYYETKGPSLNESETWYSTNVGPILENGRVKSLLLVSSDITESKEIEQRIQQMNEELEQKVQQRTQELSLSYDYLEAAKKEVQDALIKEKELGELKSRFVSTASHQFRTPLTVIQSNIELLESSLSKLDDNLMKRFNRSFSRIKKETFRMTDLMDDVLILGKINAGAIQGSFSSVNIVKIALELSNRLNEVPEVKAKIKFKVVNKPRLMQLDEKLMVHVIMNLLHNAQKYSLDRGDVLFTLTFEPEQVKMEIADRGIGISEEDVKHIFLPFHRGKNTSDIPGTGLGLTIVHEYISINQGEIKVESTLGVGTTVMLMFKTKK